MEVRQRPPSLRQGQHVFGRHSHRESHSLVIPIDHRWEIDRDCGISNFVLFAEAVISAVKASCSNPAGLRIRKQKADDEPLEARRSVGRRRRRMRDNLRFFSRHWKISAILSLAV
jgi:hypothetical protein